MVEKCHSFFLIFLVSLASLCMDLYENLWFRKCHTFLIRSPNQGMCRPGLIPWSAVVSDHTVSLSWTFSFPPSVKGYLTHLFRSTPAGNSWEEISVCTLYLNPWVGTWQISWGFSNHNFAKMLLSSETQTQCGKLKDHEALGYVEMLINSDCTEWFSFWIFRVSQCQPLHWLGLGYKVQVLCHNIKAQLF